MMYVLKLVPAVSFALLLAGTLASAEDFGKLPKYGPVPEMRPIRVTETTVPTSKPGRTFASCGLECATKLPASPQA